jgi:transcription-repair coupling factor (superfamily II helicase)
MRDLEIRGAGNLLGAAQSGHIHDVGLDLYSQLLQEAVRELAAQQGEPAPLASPSANGLPRLNLPLPGRIPESYIDHLPTRLSVYQRVARITDRREVSQLQEELRDRFGPLPQEAENLLLLADLRALAGSIGVESIGYSGEALVLTLRAPVGGARVPLQQALGPSTNVGNQQIHLPMRRLGDQWLLRLTKVLERFQAFQERLLTLKG